MLTVSVLMILGLYLVNETVCFEIELLAITIENEETDSFLRYQYTAHQNGIQTERYSFDEPWRGSDVVACSSGGFRVNILKDSLGHFAGRSDLILIYTDSDAVFIDSGELIIQKFQKFNARIVFAADRFIWPDRNLRTHFPDVSPEESRFLNAGAFIGYASDIVEMVNYRYINDMEDDQLYFTRIFIDRELRERWSIKIDTKSELFQNLVGSFSDVEMRFDNNRSYLYNTKTNTVPSVIYGNGPVKSLAFQGAFHSIANYLGNGWTPSHGCLSCNTSKINLTGIQEESYPIVQLSIFIDQPTPFLVEALQDIANLDYPKNRIDVFIHNMANYHQSHVDEFVTSHTKAYKSITMIAPDDKMNIAAGRNFALSRCLQSKCEYMFFVLGHVHLMVNSTLKDLIEQNRTIIAPMLSRPSQWWSNFWGAITDHGSYSKSEDYEDIAEFRKRGLWNVPFIRDALLINGSIIPNIQNFFTDPSEEISTDESFIHNLKNKGIFLFVDNMKYRGHLVNFDDFDISHLHNDMYRIFQNPFDWEIKYMHRDYSTSLQEGAAIAQPCPDVYWFPVISETFCDHMIDEMENYGNWHSGSHEDTRLDGGYENVPTVDIHMKQISFEEEFLHFLEKYIKPLQKVVFPGANPSPTAIMNFVVRYRPDEQPELQPHDDSSTYTINIGLNKPGIDYTGGGVKFLRYNCTIVGTKKGWLLMHPGRLTHHHQGLRTLSGTRYILVSFVDP